MARNRPPKSLRGEDHVNDRIHDFPRHVLATHQTATAVDATGIETRPSDRHGSIGAGINDSLRDFQWCDGSDSSRAVNQPSDERYEASLRVHRRQLLSRRPDPSERVKPLLDIALYTANAEVTRFVICAGWKTLLTTMRFLK